MPIPSDKRLRKIAATGDDTTEETQAMALELVALRQTDAGRLARLESKLDSLLAGVGVCRECGCTEDHACETDDGPCHWAEPGLCSACA